MIGRSLLTLLIWYLASVGGDRHLEGGKHRTRPHLETSDERQGKARKHHHPQGNVTLKNVKGIDNGLPRSTTSPKFLKDLLEYRLKNSAQDFVSSLPKITDSLLSEMGGLIEEETPAQGYIYNPHEMPFPELLDVAFVFEKHNGIGYDDSLPPERVFENWKSEVMGYNCIILGDKEVVKHIKIPAWMQDHYEVYSREDIRQTLLDAHITDSHFLSNIIRTLREINGEEATDTFSEAEVHSVFEFIDTYALAAWVSDREYTFVVDNNYVPPPVHAIENGEKLTHSVLEKHIANLKTPALPFYYGGQSDPYLPGYDFVHSYPFPQRGGVSAVISHGRSVGEHFADPITKLAGTANAAPHMRISNHDFSRTDTVPSGQFFSMKRDNLAFNRNLLGPAMLFFGNRGGLKMKRNFENSAFHNYHDIVAGWIMKVVIDHCNWGTKFGAPYVYRAESPASRYSNHPDKQGEASGAEGAPGSSKTTSGAEKAAKNIDKSRRLNEAVGGSTLNAAAAEEEDIVVNHVADNDADILKKRRDKLALLYDVKSNFTFLADERIYNFFHDWKLNRSSLTYFSSDHCGGRFLKPECIVSEMAIELETHAISQDYNYFRLLSHYMRLWLHIWDHRHSFLASTFPLAMRSSFAPRHEPQTPKCAMITITHNEKQLLPVWLRYHLKHFHPSDIYILDHITDDNSTHPSLFPKELNLMKLEGNKYTMPVLFRSNVIKIYQDRLLRAGYKCVLFSDTDELVVPNPLKYPKGLKQYLHKFANDPKQPLYWRVTGIELGHMSYGNGKPSSQEPPLDWSRSILAQRSFYALDRVYNKPLLSKVPIAYRPGFHRFYNYRLDKSVETDPDLVMFHLRSMDFNFCMQREVEKFNMTRNMEQAELNAGFASHWNSYQRDKKTGELCKYAIGCYLGEYQENVTKMFDNTGVFPMYKLDDYWKTVDL